MGEAAVMRAEARDSERKFYSRMAIFLVLVVLLGFGPSFYLRGVVPPYPRPNPTLPPSVILHGVLLSLWMLVFIAQTQLVAARRTDVHMKLGAASMALALTIIPVMYLATVWQVARANQPPFTDPLTWTILPLAVIPGYALLVWWGWQRRREAQWHKRLMLSAATLLVIGPAFGRLPLSPPVLPGFTLQMLAGYLILFAPLIWWDRRTIGQLHPATRRALLTSALSMGVPLAVFWSGFDWAAVARHLPGVA